MISSEKYWCVHCRKGTKTWVSEGDEDLGKCVDCQAPKPVTVEDDQGRQIERVREDGTVEGPGPVESAGRGYPLFDFGQIAFTLDEITEFGDAGRDVARYLIRTLRERVLEYVRDAERSDGTTGWRNPEYGSWPGPEAERKILEDFYGYADEREGDRALYVSRRSARLRGDPTAGAQRETVALEGPL